MSDCWTAHFWVRTQQGIILCQRCGVWYTQPWTAVDAPSAARAIIRMNTCSAPNQDEMTMPNPDAEHWKTKYDRLCEILNEQTPLYEALKAENERLQVLIKGLAETMSRVYCRLQCADVPRDPWQNEVSVWLIHGSVRDWTDPEMHGGDHSVSERDAAGMQAVIEALYKNKQPAPSASAEDKS